jgi:amidohydrolase
VTVQLDLPSITQSLITMRRDLHQHPELGFKEFRTSGILADHLEQLGLEVKRGIAGTGVVARLRGAQPGRTVMVRADIDALPIHEETNAPYASTTAGVMHACGHDGHASVAAHVATLLSKQRENLKGDLLFVFQPAEEIVGGATKMIAEGVMEGVDAVVGLHLWNDLPAGQVSVRTGPQMAAPDAFTITVHGRGGHAASPHQAKDPVLASAHLIVALQGLVSRETNPVGTSVITIATVRAGEGAHNIIPERVELKGTLRTFDPDLRKTLEQRIREVANGISTALGCRADIDWIAGPPPVTNDEHLTERFRAVARQVVGPENVHVADQIMGGDDMAEFLVMKPGVYFFVGSADASAGKNSPHHHPKFDIDDERALPIAAELLARAALDFLNE